MKAIGVYEALPSSDQNCFEVIEMERPSPTGRDILIRIDAISINPVDSKERQGLTTRREEALILGWDACGEVISVGDAVQNFKAGDMVISAGDITKQGSYAQYQLLDERIVGHKPNGLSNEEAATLPLTTLAAWEALFQRLEIARHDVADQALLIIGGAGGLGSMAIQFARQFSKCRVIATASRPETQKWCHGLGAHHVIDHSKNLREQIKEIGFDTVPFILNCSNNIPYWEVMSELVSPEGAICLMASTKAKLDLDLYMAKSIRIHYQLMFTKSIYGTDNMHLQGELLSKLSDMIAQGKVRHVMTKNLGPMSRETLRQAHHMIETGRMIGKIALSALK